MYNTTSRVKRALPILIILFFSTSGLFNNSSAQIIIKEKLELKNDSSLLNPVKTRSYIDDRINALFPRYSGSVTLEILPYTQDKLKGEWSLYESNYGQLSGPINWEQGVTVNVSSFQQWQKLDFYLKNKEGTSERHALNSYILESDETKGFVFESITRDNSVSPGIYYPRARATLSPDSLKPAIPGEEVFYLFYYNSQNPYEPTQAFAVPDSGLLVAKINSVRDDANFALYRDLPNNKLLSDDLNAYEGDTLWIGYMSPSEQFRLFIKSDLPGVEDTPIYPISKNGPTDFEELIFEGWTDMQFDDIDMELYLGHHPKEPLYLDVDVDPDTLAPGDTASVEIVGYTYDRSTIPFDKDHRFNVELDGNEWIATLLHPNQKDTADVFENIPNGFKIIANNPSISRTLFSRIRVSTKADGPYVKNKKITGREYFDVKKSKLEPCKGVFPDIDVKGDRQPDNWEQVCGDGEAAGSTFLKTEDYKADIQACFSNDLMSWKGELIKVDADIKYALCPSNAQKVGLLMINSAYDSDITEENYCSVISKIQSDIDRIEKGGEKKVYYAKATLAHEKKHVEQIRDVIDKVILSKEGLYEKLNSKQYTITKNKASNKREAQEILNPFFEFLWTITRDDIYDQLINMSNSKEFAWQRSAEKEAHPLYRELIEDIEKRADSNNWQKCSE